MNTNYALLPRIGKLVVAWMIVVVGLTAGWLVNSANALVMQSPTTSTLSITPSSAMAGQTVTLTMTVTGTNPAAPPAGTVVFKEGLNVVLASVPLNNGIATLDTRFNTTGLHAVTASYGGDTNNGGTSKTTWFTITAAATTIHLTASANPVRPGQAVTLTATVTGANPTGTITFKNGNTILGAASLAAGSATLAQAFNTVGDYSLMATYSGDTNNLTSASSPITVAVTVEPQVYYIHTDHLDTPRTITDTSGNVVWQWDNADPFGINAPNESPGGAGQFIFNLRFAGQYHDRETGLHYNVNRDYSPALGRYIESDPAGLAGGTNSYTYVSNNPLRFTDPLGLVPNPAEGACIAGPNPVCVGGVLTDIGTSVLGGGALAGILMMSGDSASNSDAQRQAEYERAKKFCDTPPPPSGNDCSTLSKQIDHAEQCISLYEAWDNKWLLGRHGEKIQTWRNRLQNLKDEHKRKCTNKCP
ncbi:MAG TPA: Ig-like domain repeat protein [Gallionella sp.]|nr:Ig-like domain repeat protein [Gallionella sp.]